MVKTLVKKLINIPIIQVSFMYLLQISAVRSTEIIVKTIVKTKDRNAGMQNVLNCQITVKRKMSTKLCKILPNFVFFQVDKDDASARSFLSVILETFH